MQAAPPGAPTRAAGSTTRGGVARFLLAPATAWAGVVGAWRLDAFARTVRQSGLVPAGSDRALALVWCVAALVAAVALVNPRTVHAGALLALVVAACATAVSIAAWARGTPVLCTCVSAAVRHTTRDHLEALVGDVVLLVLALATLRASRRHAASV